MQSLDFVDTRAFGMNSLCAMIVYVHTRSTKNKIVQKLLTSLRPRASLCAVWSMAPRLTPKEHGLAIIELKIDLLLWASLGLSGPLWASLLLAGLT